MRSLGIQRKSIGRPFAFMGLLACFFTISACKQRVIPVWHLKESAEQGAVKEAYLPDSYSVAFDIVRASSETSSDEWIAKYTKGGKTARFRIILGESAQPPGKKNPQNFVIGMGNGRIEPEPGSDDSVLLVDLKKVLEASKLPQHVHKERSLTFTYAEFGENQSQIPGGGFKSNPPGHWTVMKAFLGDEDNGEFYLNINPALGKAQLSEKDSSYGDYVLAKLATVI